MERFPLNLPQYALKLLWFLFLILFASWAGHGADIVVPNDLEFVEGNVGNLFPFGIPTTNASMRYQQVYDASQFSKVPSGGWITDILFRVDGMGGYAFTATLDKIQVDLSSVSRPPDGLSSTFSENIGTNEAIIFGPSEWKMSSRFGGVGSGPFDIRLPLSKLFFYNPSKGNLLLDVRNFVGSFGAPQFPPAFDATSITNDSVSRVYATSVDAVSAAGVDTLGLVTQFLIYPTPQLTIAQQTNTVVITWPTQPTVFVLQAATSLKPANWQPITNGISGNFLKQTLTLPLESSLPTQYFRLAWPEGPAGIN